MFERTRRAADDRTHTACSLALFPGNAAEFFHSAQHIIAPAKCTLVVLVGTEPRGGLNHTCKHCSLSDAKVFRPFAEPAARGRLYADEIRPERCAVEILRKNPDFRFPPLHLQRHNSFLPLPPHRFGMRLDQAHRLHADCRSPRYPSAVKNILKRRTHDTQRPYSAMRPELTVFRCDESFYDPVVFIRAVIWTAVHITLAETYTHHLAGRIAQNKPAGIILRPFIIPADESK